MTTPNKSIGQIAYEAYCTQAKWKSLASGQPLPKWPEVKPEIQEAWQTAAEAVRQWTLLNQDPGVD